MSASRLHIGQLLTQTTRMFQAELFGRLGEAGLHGARVPHTHVTAYIKAEGSRLTDLAAAARMTLPAMSELVDDLQALGYVERRPDPSDGRAKLICLTDRGWDGIRAGQRVIAELEAEWAGAIGQRRFEAFLQTFQALHDHVAGDHARR
jgi:DNA-binding MarR family transcriptional regulator